MNKAGKGTEVDRSVQVVPVPPGWWYGYCRGWKQNRTLYKPSKFSVNLGAFWWQCCSFFNSGNLPEKDKWVLCLLHEFFLTDWNTLTRGISENQKQRLDKIKDAIGKFISAGLDQQYSSKDPIRAWLSFIKRSDEAPGIHKKLLAEISTMGEKPQLYSVDTWLGPMNYNPDRPYDLGVPEITDEGLFSDFDITNGLIPEVPTPKDPTQRRSSTDSNVSQPGVPYRNDGSHLEQPRQTQQTHPNFQNNGNMAQIQNVVSQFGQAQMCWQKRLDQLNQRGVNHVTSQMMDNVALGVNHDLDRIFGNQNINMGQNQNTNVGMHQNTFNAHAMLPRMGEGMTINNINPATPNNMNSMPNAHQAFSANASSSSSYKPPINFPCPNDTATPQERAEILKNWSRPKSGGISFEDSPPQKVSPPKKKKKLALEFTP